MSPSKNRRMNRSRQDESESIRLQRTPSNNSGLRIVGSGTNLSLMGDQYDGIKNLQNSPSTSSKMYKTEAAQFIASNECGEGRNFRPFPVQRESTSMTDITDMMYLQQRKCETCSSVIFPSVRSNW